MLGFLFDVIIIVLLILFTVDGFKRGFVLSFLNFIAYILALVLSSFLASVFSKIIFNQFIYDKIVQRINLILLGTMGQDVNIRATKVFEGMPKFISSSLNYYSVTPKTVASTIENSANNAALDIANLISPVIINTLKTVLIIIFFALLIWAIRILVKMINKVFKLPILKQLNKLLGAVFGAVKCIIILFIAMLFIRVFVPIFYSSSTVFSNETINSTIVFKTIYNYNPLYFALKQ